MNINSKWMWNIFVTLIVIGFLGIVFWSLSLMLSSQGNEYYLSARGYRLTPVGGLSLLATIPVICFFLWFFSYRQKKSEKDFIKQYEEKSKRLHRK